MKIATIILVHNHPLQLERLLYRLQSENCKTFVHVDLKCDINDFSFLHSMPNVESVKKRINVKWGGYSMIEAIIECFNQVVGGYQSFDYINLISGQDYPIQPVAVFKQFLENRPNRDFFEFFTSGHPWIDEIAHRVGRYHLTDYKFKGSTLLERILNVILPHKKLPKDFEIIGHSGWFTIDIESAIYVLKFFKENKSFVRKFKFSWGADEFLIPSILYNSPLKHKIINTNLRYIDWSEGKASPKILTIADFDNLQKSTSFFARKFDVDIDSQVLDLLDKKIGYQRSVND